MCSHCLFDISGDTVLKGLTFGIQATTLFIAYRIYRNFDVKKQFLNKQLAVVSDLTGAISKTQFEIGCYFKPPPIDNPNLDVKHTHGSTIWNDNLFALTSIKKQYSKVYIHTNNIVEIFPFLEFRNNPFVPSKIAKYLNELYMAVEYNLPTIKEDEQGDYVLLYVKANRQEGERTRYRYYYKTLDELCKEITGLREEIVTWLKQYGAEDINF